MHGAGARKDDAGHLGGQGSLGEPPMRLRVMILDDEGLARRLLRSMLSSWPDVEVVGDYGDSRAAVAAILRDRPDILFLDIKMPGLDGFGVIASLPADRLPLVVFVTAHAEHAPRAFEVPAVDYLLKPFDDGRLGATLGRLRERVRRPDADPGPSATVSRDVARFARQLAVRSREGERIFLLATDKIQWLEAAAKWIKVYGAGDTWLVRGPLQKLEEVLDPSRFLRISRSAIVNVEHVREIQPWFGGDFVVVLEKDKRFRTSGTYRDAVRDLIANRPR